MITSGKVGEGNAFCGESESKKKALRDQTGWILIQHLLIISGMKYLIGLLYTKEIYNTGKLDSKLCSIHCGKNYVICVVVSSFE